MKGIFKKFSTIALMAIMTVLMFSVTASAAYYSGYSIVQPAEGDYYLGAYSDNNYAIDVTGGSTASCTYVQLYTRSNGNAAQIFTLERKSGDWYAIKNKNSGLCLNVEGGNGRTNGTRLWMYPYDNTDSCLFRFLDAGNGNYIIQNKIDNKVIDLDNNLRFNGSRIHLWSFHTGSSAKWKLIPAAATKPKIVENGVYLIKFKNTNMGLNVQFAPSSGIGNIVLDPVSDKQGNECWKFQYNSKYDAYYITPEYRSSAAINALYGASASRGSQVRLHDSNINDTASLWKIETYGSYVRFKNVACGYYIDIDNGRTNSGTRANLWTDSASNQVFTLTYLRTASTTSGTSSSSWQYPMTNAYVCGNDWRTYYSKRPSRPYHVGIDIASKTGDSAVYAALNGVVAKTGYNSSNGNYVIIKHSFNGKTVYSFYAHLSKINTSQGVSVSKGSKIGVYGNTGDGSSGTHLHFAIVDTLWSNGSYYGYATYFSGNKTTFEGVTYYNPHYVIQNNKLP